jgi:hypothetical protein
MLAGMNPPSLATLRAVADLHGFPWSDAELEAARPAVGRLLEMLASLDAVALDEAAEPTTHFRADGHLTVTDRQRQI